MGSHDVINCHIMPSLHEFIYHMRTNKTASSNDRQSHALVLLSLLPTE